MNFLFRSATLAEAFSSLLCFSPPPHFNATLFISLILTRGCCRSCSLLTELTVLACIQCAILSWFASCVGSTSTCSATWIVSTYYGVVLCTLLCLTIAYLFAVVIVHHSASTLQALLVRVPISFVPCLILTSPTDYLLINLTLLQSPPFHQLSRYWASHTAFVLVPARLCQTSMLSLSNYIPRSLFPSF